MTQRLGAFCCFLVVAALAIVAVAPAAEAGWLPPVDLSEPAEHTGAPQVVLDSEGDATAVWDRWDGSQTVVESAYRPAGEGWEAPVDISATELSGGVAVAGGSAQSPRIAVDGAGDVTVVFERWAVGGIVVQSAERPAGGAWTVPVGLDEPVNSANPEPWVAVDTAGDAIAVWEAGAVVQSAYRPAGEAWGAATAVSGEESFVAQAAMNAAGDATIVWLHHTGGLYVVESAFRPASGGWEAPTLVSEPGEEGGDPQIALDASGDTLVAWRGEDEGTEFVRTAFRPLGEAWEAPTDASNAGEQVQAIQDAVDPAGDAIVAWSGSGGKVGEYETVRAAFQPAAGGWEAPVELSATGGNGFPSDVVFDQGGNAAIIWQRQVGSADIVEASYRPQGGDWEAAAELSEAGKESFDPVVVLDAPGVTAVADGDATAVWVSEETVPRGGPKGGSKECFADVVQAAGYDPEGLPEVELELPASAEVGEPVPVTLAAGLFSPLIEFGDGESATGTATSHTYDVPGEYDVSGSGAEVLGYSTSAVRTIKIVPVGEGGGSGGSSTPPTPRPPADPTDPAGQVLEQHGSPPASGASSAGQGSAGAPNGGVPAACRSARAGLHAAQQRLKHSAAPHRSRAGLKKARRRVAAAC
jgi:hypothetical protein